MRAKITAESGFLVAPEGHTVITIPAGTIVEGKLAELALSAHVACRMFDPVAERKVVAKVETKRGARK